MTWNLHPYNLGWQEPNHNVGAVLRCINIIWNNLFNNIPDNFCRICSNVEENGKYGVFFSYVLYIVIYTYIYMETFTARSAMLLYWKKFIRYSLCVFVGIYCNVEENDAILFLSLAHYVDYLHWENYVSYSLHIEWDMSVVTVFLPIFCTK